MSGSSPWNDSGFASAPNTNTLDARAMPSDKAAAARQKAQEVMAALEDGKPGAADRMMGEREAKGNVGIVPIDWVRSKFSRKGKKEGKEGNGEKRDGVVR